MRAGSPEASQPPAVTVELDSVLVASLRREARKRELSVPSLARALLTVIAENGLAHAILDD
jgi:hypothetical protein